MLFQKTDLNRCINITSYTDHQIKENYLWNGNSFDKLEDEEREVLLYSGQSVNAEDAAEALATGKAAAKKEFPGDENQDIKKVEVKVS